MTTVNSSTGATSPWSRMAPAGRGGEGGRGGSIQNCTKLGNRRRRKGGCSRQEKKERRIINDLQTPRCCQGKGSFHSHERIDAVLGPELRIERTTGAPAVVGPLGLGYNDQRDSTGGRLGGLDAVGT